jgi:hypothetical protein
MKEKKNMTSKLSGLFDSKREKWKGKGKDLQDYQQLKLL